VRELFEENLRGQNYKYCDFCWRQDV
jgi:hypothetical protein